MRTRALLVAIIVAVAGVPAEEPNGWFVPLRNGSFEWIAAEQFESEAKHIDVKIPPAQFFLYTKINPSKPHQLYINDTVSLSNSNFHKSLPTKFIIHGWTNSFKSQISTQLRQALLNTGSYNVIVVDWSKTSYLDYISARYSVANVGQFIALFLDFLNLKAGMSFNNLTLIGYSLGAHIAGFAGKHVTGGEINTIFGLDPAYPLFTYSDCSKRLCSSDATHVESIHTCGEKLGFLQPIGKAAFYPNGGRIQPGCLADLSGFCSHQRSYKYLAEAIQRKNFRGIRCPDYNAAVKNKCEDSYGDVSMGNNFGISGVYYVPVNSKQPFGTGNVLNKTFP